MPRKSRIHVPGAFYHVTLRGNHRQDIFFSHEHRQWLSEIVAEVIARFAARVHAYCWMSNHVHLLVQVSDGPLGRLMLRIASQYARRVQLQLCTTGHLFERRYHAVLVDEDEYLLTLIRYIHMNPVRAKMVASPDHYLWSSHGVYSGKEARPWVTSEFALNLFHSDAATAQEAYRRFVANEVGQVHLSKPFDELNRNDRRILGDDNFVARMQGIAWRPRSRKTLDEVIAEACAHHQVTHVELQSRSAKRELARARAWIAQQCIEGRIASVSAVAQYFGRDESTLRESMQRYFSKSN